MPSDEKDEVFGGPWHAIFLLVAYVLTLLTGYFLIRAASVTASAIPMFALATGFVLFRFRCKARLVHGILEIAAGLTLSVSGTMKATEWKATATAVLLRSDQLLPVVLAVASAIFIVVRGCDNIREARRPG